MDDFVAGLSDRARQLVWSLDDRYLSWANQLPEAFRVLALNESTFTGRPGERFYRLSQSVNPVNMHSAWLFWDLFDGLSDERFIDIAEAGAFWSMSAILLDHLVDGQMPDPGVAILFQHKLSQHSRSCFNRIFPAASPFWTSFGRYESMYIDALGVESIIQKSPEELNYEAFVETARAKAATMLVTIAAFSEATGQADLLAPVDLSIRLCAQAGQLYDDLQDWQIDLANRHVTWVQARILNLDSAFLGPSFDQEVIREKFEQDGLSLRILNEVLDLLSEAERMVEGLNCPGWKNFLAGYRDIVRRDQKSSAVNFLQRAFSPVIGENALHRNK